MEPNHSTGGRSSSSFPVEELHAEQEVSEEELLPPQETGRTGACQLERSTFRLVLICPGVS